MAADPAKEQRGIVPAPPPKTVRGIIHRDGHAGIVFRALANFSMDLKSFFYDMVYP